MKRNIRVSRDVRISAGAVFWGLIFLVSGCGAAPVRQQSRVDTAMGTIVTQTLYVRQEDGAVSENRESDAEDIFIMQLLEDLERQELSWRVEGSEVAEINARASAGGGDQTAAGGLERPLPGDRTRAGTGREPPMRGEVEIIPSSALREILEQIWRISADSDGALDVTLGRLSRLWNMDELAGEERQISIPSTEQIRSALGDTGYERARLEGDVLTLPVGMQLDLGAVGKGAACDRVSAYLHSQPQITGAVVAVGGSVVTYGEKPDGSPWKVAIVHPREEGSYLGILSLTGGQYVSTSGDYERYVMVDGIRYHHILDPATGYPARSGLCSVTILCDGGLLADALSTACFVLGPERGMVLAENYGAEALFVTEEGALQMTEGMKEIFSAGG